MINPSRNRNTLSVSLQTNTAKTKKRTLLPPANEVLGKVMFSQALVSHSVQKGRRSLSLPGQRPPWTETSHGQRPLDRDPPERDPLYDKERTGRILLERILVVSGFIAHIENICNIQYCNFNIRLQKIYQSLTENSIVNNNRFIVSMIYPFSTQCRQVWIWEKQELDTVVQLWIFVLWNRINRWHQTRAVADPGFPWGGGANSPGAPTYDFAKFSQKLHEIERILAPGGVPCAPLRSATEGNIKLMTPKNINN